MAQATLSRGSTSVTFDILGSGGDLLVARDVGKPTAEQSDVGREDPLIRDDLNAGDTFTVLGMLQGSGAYADAKTLAEDLVKPRATTGTPLQLDLSDLPNKGTYDVAPASNAAATLTYAPGRVQMVGVQLQVSAVSTTNGGSLQTQANGTPDAGSGVKIERSGTSVTITDGLEVVRKVGRPNAKLQPTTGDLPILMDEAAPAEDVFEVSGRLGGANAESNANTLEETIVRARLGDDTLTLHFLGNEFGLDAYTVHPTGSQAVRTSFSAGQTGEVGVPKLTLRVVDNR